MNIKDFLMDNYIYIIIVIILIIVTIIGFLADKQKNGGKKGKNVDAPLPNNNVNNEMVNQPITYQPVNNQMGNNMNPIPNTTVIPNNNQFISNMNNNQNTLNQMNNNNLNTPQPVEPMNASVAAAPEPMYQPLSEQKPVIKPTNPTNNINNFGNNTLNNQMPQNVEPLSQSTTNQIPNNIMPVSNMFNQQTSGQTQAQNPIPTPINMPTQPKVNEMPYNNTVPVNPLPSQPEPIPNPSGNTIPSPIPAPQPTTPQPVGFVFGPQQGQNNNQQM